MGIVVIGSTFVDIKGFPQDTYIPDGRNVGRIEYVHGGVSRNVAEDIANVELRPTYVGIVDDSPLGKAARGRKEGDHCSFKVNGRTIGFTIKAIDKDINNLLIVSK